jgi:hypothetical protein
MRTISFALTERQLLDGSKTVTRRIGWRTLTAGTLLQCVRKGMGLKKGERAHKLGVIRVTSVRREPLAAITADDCTREGFPEMTPAQFIAFFCDANSCKPETMVGRIEFERVPPVRDAALHLLA